MSVQPYPREPASAQPLMKSGFRWMFLSLGLGILVLVGLHLSSLLLENPSDRLHMETQRAAASGQPVAPERASELALQTRRQARLRSIALQATMVLAFVGISFGASRLAAAQGRRIPRALWLGYALIAASMILWTIGTLRSDRILDEMDRLAFRAAAGQPALSNSSLLSEQARDISRWWNWAGSITLTAAVAMLIMAAGVPLKHLPQAKHCVSTDRS